MKVLAVAFALLLASVSAIPTKLSNEIEAAIRSGDERLTVSSIEDAIQDAAQAIRDAGLDPYNLSASTEYVFNAEAHVYGLQVTGLSDIVVNRMNYALLTSRLTFNIEWPSIALSIADSGWDVNAIGGNLNGKSSGAIVIRNIVITGDVRVSIGVLTGISIRNLSMTFSVGSVNSAINVELQGVNVSPFVNNYLGSAVPNALKNYEDDINELISLVSNQLAEALF